jgi:hypothetical protein
MTTYDMTGFVRTSLAVIDSRRGKDSECWVRYRQDIDSLGLAVDDFAKQETAIRADIALSERGKIARLVAAAQKKSVELGWWWKKPGELAAAEERLTNLLYAGNKRPAGDPVLQFLREREIRDALKGKKQSEIDSLYYNAVANRQEETLRAMIDAPGGPMPSDGAQAQVAEQQARSSNPGAFRALGELGDIRVLLDLMVARAAKWLQALGASLANGSDVVQRVG